MTLAQLLAAKLLDHPRLRAVPQPVVDEIVRLALHEAATWIVGDADLKIDVESLDDDGWVRCEGDGGGDDGECGNILRSDKSACRMDDEGEPVYLCGACAVEQDAEGRG